MHYVLVFVFLALSSLTASEQTSATVRIVPLGQLDGPRFRELAPNQCGPYFTIAPTDRKGGGFVFFGFRGAEEIDDDPTDDIRVAGFHSFAIRARLCPDCETPKAEREVNGTSEWINLSISSRDLKLSRCLRRVKLQRR
jgi:hypothetical protein